MTSGLNTNEGGIALGTPLASLGLHLADAFKPDMMDPKRQQILGETRFL